LLRIGATVPLLTAEVAAYSSAVCLGLFLFLIDRAGKMLRPSGALNSVAARAHEVIEDVYPRRLKESRAMPSETIEVSSNEPPRTVTCLRAGVVLAFDVQGLVALGKHYNCLIELLPQVGSFVAPGNPLYRIYGGADLPSGALHQSIAVGAERTIEQDPAFAFR